MDAPSPFSQPLTATATAEQPVCVVTGTGGYLGGRVKAVLAQRGWRVIGFTRHPSASSGEKPFQLGQDVEPSRLAGAQALVHCAYDFTPLRWPDVQRVNVAGTEKLLRAARAAKIEHLIYISSISAFTGCRALYGRAKLETEIIAASVDAAVIRPGLIWGDPPGATFGRLVTQVERARALPLFGGGGQVQFTVHVDDLSAAIGDLVEEKFPPPATPITIANEQPWTFHELLTEIARAKGRNVSFVRVPWRLGWAALKFVEACGLRLSFRSDNLVSLMFQNPNPSFTEQRTLGIVCRPFKLNEEGRM